MLIQLLENGNYQQYKLSNIVHLKLRKDQAIFLICIDRCIDIPVEQRDGAIFNMKVFTSFLTLAAVAQAHYDFPALISGSTKTPAVSDFH